MQADETGAKRAVAAARAEAEGLLEAAGRRREDREEEGGELLGSAPGSVLTVPAAEEEEAGSVVWLHGHGLHSAVREDLGGDDSRGWVALALHLDLPMCRFAFPAGPVPGSAGGSQAGGWFRSGGRGAVAEVCAVDAGSEEARALQRAAEHVEGVLRSEEEELEAEGRVVLGGFGHGAVVALQVAMRGRVRLAGLMLYAGWVPREVGAGAGMGLQGLPVLVGRGSEDSVVTAGMAAALEQRLLSEGARLCLRDGEEADGVGHTVVLDAEVCSSCVRRFSPKRCCACGGRR